MRHSSDRWGYPVAFIAWALVIVGCYYAYHPQYLLCAESIRTCILERGIGDVIWSLVTHASARFGYIVLGLYAVLILWRRNRVTSLSLTPLHLLIGAYLFGHGALTALLTFIPSGAIVGDTGIMFMTMQVSIVTKWGLVAIALTVLALLAASVGRFVLRACKLEIAHVYEQFLVSVGVGFIIISYAVFSLLAMGYFTMVTGFLLLVAIVLLCIQDIVWWCTSLVRHSIPLSIRLTTPWSIALVLSATIVGYTVFEILTPFPYQWDGIYRYVNTANLLVQQGGFITGVFPYPAEIMAAFAAVMFGTMMVGISVYWFYALFAAALLYVIIRQHASRDAGMLAVCALLSMPLVYIIMGIHTKIDFAALSYALLALYACMTWSRTMNKRWLYIGGVFLGMALMVKLTVVFFVIGMAAAVKYLLWRQHASWRTAITTLMVFAGCVALPIIPWVTKHIAESEQGITLHSVLQGGSTGPDLGVCSSPEEERYLAFHENPAWGDIAFTAHREDIGRFWGYEKRTALSYLLLPWHITMNPSLNSWLINIGPLLLIMLPIVLIGLAKNPTTPTVRNEFIAPLAVATGTAYIAWALFAEAVTWYALPILVAYMILAVWVCSERYAKSPWHIVWMIVVCIAVVPNLLFRFATGTDGSRYLFVSGAWTEEQLWQSEPPYFQGLADHINADAPTTDDPKYVYNIATTMLYRIHHNDTRVYTDQYLDSLHCLLETNNNDFDATTTYLAEHGFKYLLATPDVASADITPDLTLVAKARRATEYVNAMMASGRLKVILEAGMQLDKVIAFEIQ